MWRAVPLLLALQAALVFSGPLDGTLPTAEGDDECLAGGEGGCALSALQRRGARLSSQEQEAGIELKKAEDPEDPDASVQGKIIWSDISSKDAAQMLKRIKKHRRNAVKAQKMMDEVEKAINDTYVMTMKELNPGKDVVPPPMQPAHGGDGKKKGKAHSGRRRRRHRQLKLPRRMKKVDASIRACENLRNAIWKRVKRSSDILVFTRKRIMGGEIIARAVLMNGTQEGGDALAAGGGPEAADVEDVPAEGAVDGGAEVSVKMGREDLEVRIKRMNAETYDLKRDIKELEKRNEKTKKLFKDTFRVK